MRLRFVIISPWSSYWCKVLNPNLFVIKMNAGVSLQFFIQRQINLFALFFILFWHLNFNKFSNNFRWKFVCSMIYFPFMWIRHLKLSHHTFPFITQSYFSHGNENRSLWIWEVLDTRIRRLIKFRIPTGIKFSFVP